MLCQHFGAKRLMTLSSSTCAKFWSLVGREDSKPTRDRGPKKRKEKKEDGKRRRRKEKKTGEAELFVPLR